jgi:transposase
MIIMRLSVSKSVNSASLYVIKSIYENGVRSTKVVEKLGTEKEIRERLGGADPYEWARQYVAELTRKEEESRREVRVMYSPVTQISKQEQRCFNGGYLFLQKIYRQLRLDKICREIKARNKFDFNLDSILSRLLFGRIIYPASKLETQRLSTRFLEPPDFTLHQIYRALDVMAKESDYIQAQLYRNSMASGARNTGILYYDCTNFFFETEEEGGLRQYGVSKENRPNPIVQTGLFMDGDGIPLCFCVNRGNTNEQVTMRPLEQKILDDFSLSHFVVCTDSGLASAANKRFNAAGDRGYITTQSIKKMKAYLREWALDPKGWRLPNNRNTYDVSSLDEGQERDKIFYKEQWIKEGDIEERLIVTYSLKYRDYLRALRNRQIDRALDIIKKNPGKLKKARQTDCKRFIVQRHCTPDGELAQKTSFSIDEKMIAAEEAYDGFYAVCTNLEGDASRVIAVNRRRWEVEECFRIIKSEFKARPIYLSRDERIEAHLLTCFLALVLYRYLEKALGGGFTCRDIIGTLRDMNFLKVKGEGYIPAYTRTDLTDALHEAFGFRTDFEIIRSRDMKNIFKALK